MNLIKINTESILELLKNAYYDKYGETIQIGSPEFAASSAQAYAWTVLLANINEAARNLFIETANGEYLDAIAANYGIEKRPDAYPASATFTIKYTMMGRWFPAGSIIISDDNGNTFTNTYEIYSPLESYTDTNVTLYATEIGTKYNGIPANKIKNIDAETYYVETATNTTPTSGGTDGFPYTDEGNEAYRLWLKTQIQTFAGAGTYEAYTARALNADSRVKAVYVLKQGDLGYEKGKVQIYVYADPSVIHEVVATVQNACNDESFRPIGDLVVTKVAPVNAGYTNLDLMIIYPERFSYIASARSQAIIDAYAQELLTHIGQPFKVDELCHRLCAKDADGIYAIDAYARNTSTGTLYKEPDPGCRLMISGIEFTLMYR